LSTHAYPQDIETYNNNTGMAATSTTEKTIHRLNLARQTILDRFEAEHKENFAAAANEHKKRFPKAPQHSNPTNNTTTIASIPYQIVDASIDAKRNALTHTLDWLEHVVIGYNLCPFAETPLLKSEIAVVVVLGSNTSKILATCLQECLRLQTTPGTSLVVCPDLCPHDFLGFLEIYNVLVEGILPDHDLEDDLQIAPFHPKFVFGDNEDKTRKTRTRKTMTTILPTIPIGVPIPSFIFCENRKSKRRWTNSTETPKRFGNETSISWKPWRICF